MSNNNYALNSPITRNLYIPGESEVPFAPVVTDKLKIPTETDQSYRHFQWLFHKPQNSVIFPIQAEAVKMNKKTFH